MREMDQMKQNKTRRSEEHTSELQSQSNLVCRLLLEKKNPEAGPAARGRASGAGPFPFPVGFAPREVLLPTGNLPISNFPRITTALGFPALRGSSDHPEMGARVRREGDPAGRPRLRRGRGVPVAGAEEGGGDRPVLPRDLHADPGARSVPAHV